MEENKTIESSPSWLQRLKNESWEAEILVSAVAIFGIFKAFNLLNWVCDMLINKLDPSQYDIGYMITFLGFFAFGILGALFVIHFGLRAYWIGLVGLNSVFPDYSMEDSAYSKAFTKKMTEKLPRLQTSIKSLDEICSVIFSVAFTLLLMYAYLGLFASLYLLLYNILLNYVPYYVLLIPLVLISIVFILQGLLMIVANIKKFKEHETIQKWYFHSTIWGSMVFYGPLYKNLLQVTMIFGSNFKKKKSLVRTLIFMLVFGMILGVYQLTNSNYRYFLRGHIPYDSNMAQDFYYRKNNQKKNFLLAPEIETDLVTDKTTALFIPVFDSQVSLLEKKCNLKDSSITKIVDPDEKRKRLQRAYLDCYRENHTLFLNDKLIKPNYKKTDHPITGQFGIKTFVDLSDSKRGDLELKIVKQLGHDTKKTWIIPFYYSP